jgi:beta-galactosidase
MLKRLLMIWLFAAIGGRVCAQQTGTQLFDDGWHFFRGGAQGAENPKFDDSKWRKIDLPHDWSIEDLPGTKSPFSQTAISQVSGGFTTGGTGRYRKQFTIPADQKGKRIIIQFDGVYMNATVFVNGHNIGQHPYGYTSFWYDLTDYINFGGNNVIAVEVKNEGQNSRWYSGSGIYRHVWLITEEPVHIAQWGSYITTPEVSPASAKVHVRTMVLNEGSTDARVQLVCMIYDKDGNQLADDIKKDTIKAGGPYLFDQTITVDNPQLWSCESPVLYKVKYELRFNGRIGERTTADFGIRKISFDVNNGFMLNGKTIKLKGGCFHNDNGPLGSKAYDRAEERKVELLKASGYNAIRCSHNPPSSAFLDACDRLGMLVMDEAFDCWRYGKNAYDYHLYFDQWWQKDVESMVTRDRNHPSVIMWSIGNEIPERATPEGVNTAKTLVAYIKSLDNTRPVTSAVNDLKPDKDPYFSTLDVGGYNYAVGGDSGRKDVYGEDHARAPDRIMVGTESYPLEAFGSWMAVEDHPYVIGDFVWTAWDYIGEASIGWLGYWQESSFYPWNLAYCGDIDICGWKRPQSYYRDALWKPDQLSIFVTPPKPSFATNPHIESWSKWNWLDAVADWNWNGYENKPVAVNIYSSCAEVELFLNGKSLGKKETNRSTKFIATWDVPYKPGKLEAIGYDGGKQVNQAVLNTASAPVSIKLTADNTSLKANNQDLSYITVELRDKHGILNPRAENLLHFKINGAATIAGVGNANPRSLESFQLLQRKAWRGTCLVILKTTGKPGIITLTVSADGIPAKTITLQSN